jgi:DNA (cytosine-5)-methyltransferase 1
MIEINSSAYHGSTVVSTFSGGGGSSLGYRMAGFKVLWANEFIDEARETYRANFPTTKLGGRDIRDVRPEDILRETGLAEGELDLFDGSPPCAAFSVSGKGADAWGTVKKYSDKAQRVDDLFFEYTRLLRGLQPRVFVAENVKGLIKGKAKGYFKLILAELKSCGYNVEARIVNALYLGVAQSRERMIFIGVRSDLDAAPVYPKPFPYVYTIREALDGCDATVERELSMAGYQIGREWRTLKPGEWSEKRFNLWRAHFDVPCQTIVAITGNPTTASVAHPTECRKFSVAETKRLCGFPDDFVLTGDPIQKIERLGRAVPPPMMRAIASTLETNLLSRVEA